ncbi:hypothetical protein MTO96_014378 [Rhipicephalus appendiculatus]
MDQPSARDLDSSTNSKHLAYPMTSDLGDGQDICSDLQQTNSGSAASDRMYLDKYIDTKPATTTQSLNPNADIFYSKNALAKSEDDDDRPHRWEARCCDFLVEPEQNFCSFRRLSFSLGRLWLSSINSGAVCHVGRRPGHRRHRRFLPNRRTPAAASLGSTAARVCWSPADCSGDAAAAATFRPTDTQPAAPRRRSKGRASVVVVSRASDRAARHSPLPFVRCSEEAPPPRDDDVPVIGVCYCRRSSLARIVGRRCECFRAIAGRRRGGARPYHRAPPPP